MEKISASPPPRKPFLKRIEKICSQLGDEPAVIGPDGQVLRTFADVLVEAARWGEVLRGIPCVSLHADNCAGWPGALLGIWQAGAVAVPCEASGGEPTSIEALCGASARIAARGGELALVEGIPARPLPTGALGADLMKVTSGTTLTRRAVVFEGGQLLADAENVCNGMGIVRPDRNLAAIPFAHSYGLTSLIGALLFRGIPMVLADDSMPRALIEAAAAGRATVFPGVPVFFRALAGVGVPLATIRLCISAGAPLADRDALAFFEATGLKAHSFYGASECGGICYDAEDCLRTTPGFVGKSLPGVTLHETSDPDGLRIAVRGPAVGRCYLPSTPSDALADGTYEPSDILERSAAGLRIVGRVSDFINISGRKVNPVEIEAVLLAHPAVHAAVVFAGTSAAGRGEVIAACVVSALPKEALHAHCAERVPAWQLPRHWFHVASIPCNERGKTSRLDLRHRFFPSQDLPEAGDVPHSE